MDKNSRMYKEMRGAYVQAVDAHSYDITGLYLQLEKIYAKYREKNEAKDGEEFLIDLGIGTTLRLVFHKGSTEVYAWNFYAPGASQTQILSRRDSSNKEYAALRGFGQAMSLQGLSIGKSCPFDFQKMLDRISPGTLISFAEGKTYVCKEKKDGIVSLDEVFDGDLKNIDIKRFVLRESIEVDTHDPSSMQRFYQQNRKALTGTLETDYAVLDNCKLMVKEIESDVSILHSKKVEIGPVSLVVKREKKGISWHAATGEVISPNQVAYLIGYLNKLPAVTKYIRKEPSFQKTAEDEAFRLSVEEMLESGAFTSAFLAMKVYSEENKRDLEIRTDTFFKGDNDTYEAKTILFRDGNAYKISYTESEPVLELLSVEEFTHYCKQKYTDTYKRIFACKEQEIEALYQSNAEYAVKNRQAVIGTLAKRELKKKKDVIFKEKDFQFGESGYSDLADNLDKNDPIDELLDR